MKITSKKTILENVYRAAAQKPPFPADGSVPYSRFEDMYSYFRIKTGKDTSITLNRWMMENYHVSLEEIQEAADSRQYDIYPMMEVLKITFTSGRKLEDSGLIVARYPEGYQFGGGLIFSKTFLNEAYEKYGNFYIFPGSVFALLLLPENCYQDAMSTMTHNINKTECTQEERLSEYVYFYDGTALMKINC